MRYHNQKSRPYNGTFLLISLHLCTKKGKYKDLKEALAQDIEAFIAPMREKRESITDADVLEVLKNAGEKARARTEEKMKTVRKAIGVA